MPTGINPIRKAIVKKNLILGKSARYALRQANYSEGRIRKSTSNTVVKDCINEILSEQRKKGIIDKAWKVCEEGLENGKIKYTMAQALATKSMTERQEVNNLTPEKIIIQYNKIEVPTQQQDTKLT
jgi:hypothetical protein